MKPNEGDNVVEAAFFGKLRDVGSSLIVTVPSEIVGQLKLKSGKAYQFRVVVENGGCQ